MKKKRENYLVLYPREYMLLYRKDYRSKCNVNEYAHTSCFPKKQRLVLKPKDLREDNNMRTNEFNRHQQGPKKRLVLNDFLWP